MDKLPPELLKVPRQALDILRYMGRAGLDFATTSTMEADSGLSSRSISKGIRGLVTQGYVNHDGNYGYALTDKGTKAIGDLQQFDAAQAGATEATTTQDYHELLYAVMPNPIAYVGDATLQLGFDSPSPVSGQLILRVDVTGGTLSPTELTIELEKGATPAPQHIAFAAPQQMGSIRFRVEAMQMVSMTDVHIAGGMFFDVQLAQQNSTQNYAWQGRITLQG